MNGYSIVYIQWTGCQNKECYSLHIRKNKLYDSDSGSGLQLHTQSSPGERSGKFSVSLARMVCLVRKVKCIYVGPNVSSSAHDRGYVVNGSGAMAAILVFFTAYPNT